MYLGKFAAKEKLEIVIGTAPPQILNFFAGGFPHPSTGSGRNAEGTEERSTFGLIQEYCTTTKKEFYLSIRPLCIITEI